MNYGKTKAQQAKIRKQLAAHSRRMKARYNQCLREESEYKRKLQDINLG